MSDTVKNEVLWSIALKTALGNYLSNSDELLQGHSPEETLVMVDQGYDEVDIWEPFENYGYEDVAEFIEINADSIYGSYKDVAREMSKHFKDLLFGDAFVDYDFKNLDLVSWVKDGTPMNNSNDKGGQQ